MLKKTFAAVVALAMTLTAVAGYAPGVSDANIVGHVVDVETGEHMPYYLVKVLGTKLASLTDASGHYTFRDLTPGEYTLEASFTGYMTATVKVSVKSGQTVEANFDVRPDAFMLDQVVVTSSKSEVKRRESPSLVSVVPGKIFDRVGACSLADGLDFQPGVRVENDCQNCGFTQVRINGLDGHYSQILMNSRPVFSALTGVYGLEQIPANMIDRVEVMRGGGSALFGSSAIGGTINIITKDPMVNSARLAHTLTSIGPSGSFDNNTTLNASVVTDNSSAVPFTFTTEATPQLPNAGMEEGGNGSNHNEKTVASWGTNNPMTTSQGIDAAYTKNSGSLIEGGGRNGNCALVRTIAWGAGNAIWISLERSTIKYIDAGLLHLGASRTTRPDGYGDKAGSVSTDDLDCGIEFASRPAKLHFWYRYLPFNAADTGYAEILLKDASGAVIARNSIVISAADSFTQGTIELPQTSTMKKAAKIYVRFQSTNDRQFLEQKKANLYFSTASLPYGSRLYIDDISLEY